jgi:DNA repair protein RecO (recombination protein O)
LRTKTQTQGLIIREQAIGESDRLVTVLTRDQGVVRAFARRAKNYKDSKNSGTSLLCYSRLELYEGRDKYIINAAYPIEVFFELRRDIVRLALGQYFCELAAELVPAGVESAGAERFALFVRGRPARSPAQTHCGAADAVHLRLYAGPGGLRRVRAL